MTKQYEFRGNGYVLHKGNKIGTWFKLPSQNHLDNFEKCLNNHDALVAALTQAHNAISMMIDPDAAKRSEKTNAYVACSLAEGKARAVLEALE